MSIFFSKFVLFWTYGFLLEISTRGGVESIPFIFSLPRFVLVYETLQNVEIVQIVKCRHTEKRRKRRFFFLENQSWNMFLLTTVLWFWDDGFCNAEFTKNQIIGFLQDIQLLHCFILCGTANCCIVFILCDTANCCILFILCGTASCN